MLLKPGRSPQQRLLVTPIYNESPSQRNDYWLHRPDEAFPKQFLPGIRTVMSCLEQQINSNNMLPGLPYLDFVDSKYPCDEILAESTDKSLTVHTLFYAYGLEEVAPLFDYFGYPAEAKHYRELAQKLKQAALLNQLLSDTSIIPCETYFQFYLFRAMNHAGKADYYLNSLQPWKNMLAQDLSTFSECEANPRSDCHAWSASPNYDFLAIICGIMPASPGFKTVAITPALGQPTWLEGAVSHYLGNIIVKLKRPSPQGITGEVTLPPGLTGTFTWAGKTRALKSGKQPIAFK